MMSLQAVIKDASEKMGSLPGNTSKQGQTGCTDDNKRRNKSMLLNNITIIEHIHISEGVVVCISCTCGMMVAASFAQPRY